MITLLKHLAFVQAGRHIPNRGPQRGILTGLAGAIMTPICTMTVARAVRRAHLSVDRQGAVKHRARMFAWASTRERSEHSRLSRPARPVNQTAAACAGLLMAMGTGALAQSPPPLKVGAFAASRSIFDVATSDAVDSMRSTLAAHFDVTYLPFDSLLEDELCEVDLLLVNAWEMAPQPGEVDAAVEFVERGGTVLMNAAGANGIANVNAWLRPFGLQSESAVFFTCASARTYLVAASSDPGVASIVNGPFGAVTTFRNRCESVVHATAGSSFAAEGVVPLAVTSNPANAVLAVVPQGIHGEGQVIIITNFHVFTDSDAIAGGFMHTAQSQSLLLNIAASAVELAEAAGRPVATAGADQSVPEEDPVTLNGSASTARCGVSEYAWTQIAGTPVSLDRTNPAMPTFTAPQVPIGGETLTFQLVVGDGANGSEPDSVNITVTNVNHAPVAVADGPAAVAEGGVAALDGSHSYDDDDEAITYSWMQIGGFPVMLSDEHSPTPGFTAPYVGFGGMELIFELTVSDGTDSASNVVSVLVENVNHAPVADAGLDQTKAEETAVPLNAGSSSDPDGDALTYAWTQVAGPAVEISGADTVAPSFMSPQVGPGGALLIFSVCVDDGYGGIACDEVGVTVQDSNSPPACALARPSVAELWPPNHKMVAVSILGITDPDANAVGITILGVTQDEPIDGLGDGDTAPDAVIQGGSVLLRAERSGAGNGRVYRLTFLADDGFGGMCTGTVNVAVPHSRGRNAAPCVDDGQNYTSTGS